MDIESRLAAVGLGLPDILLPKKGVDLEKWAVVACDQHTSERDYWKRVEDFVGDAPSTLRLIFPECYLDDPEPGKRIAAINREMRRYVDEGLFEERRKSFFLVRRAPEGKKPRWGLIVCLDLERYSWEEGSRSLIRATEGTILSRIPPRKEIRKNAPLEAPHILVLINDAKSLVIGPLAGKTGALEKVYETPLMENGGAIEAWAVNRQEDLEGVAGAFESLYADLDPDNRLLFAMGDGNHSFATAKSCWEDIKKGLTQEEQASHLARFCMVEIENIFDPGLEFEAIHRVVFDASAADVVHSLSQVCDGFEMEKRGTLETLVQEINASEKQSFGLCDPDGYIQITVERPPASLAAGTVQLMIDRLSREGRKVDYIHGIDTTARLGREKGNCGILLPEISKSTFFESIIRDGAFPRKTFSMGEAQEKRYYMEARRIAP